MTNNKEKQLTILVVDDDEAQASLVAQILEQEPSYRIVTSTNGADAMKKTELHEPRIIISDYYMPVIDGCEFCRTVKNHPRLRDGMFIMLTSASEVHEKVKVLESGADELLTKPIHPDELISRVRASARIVQLQDDLRKEKAKLAEMNVVLKESYSGILDLLTVLVGLHVPDAAQRAERAKQIVLWLGEKLSMSEEEIQPVVSAAMLHEIGKISMPGDAAKKEEIQFNENERGYFPIAGHLLLSRIPKLNDVSLLIHHQLENYDGSGFPDRLMQEQIPVGSRILRAVNFLEQIAYEHKDRAQVREAIRKVQGNLLDPQIVQLLDEYFLSVDNKEWMAGKRAISVLDISAGMTLASDLNTGSGTKLLPKDTVMTVTLVERILSHHQFDPIIGSIFVYE